MSTSSGIDIGSEAIKGIVLSASKKGPMEVVSADTQPISDLAHLDDSPDKTLAISEKLRQLVKRAHLKANARRLGASGNATSIRYLQVPPVPGWRLEMLVKYEVEERLGEKEPNTYDYRILDVPETGGQYTVMLGLLREAAANDLLAIGRAGGLGQVEIDLEALALYNAYYYGHGFDTDKTVLIADIGADDMTVLLCRHGSLYFARTIMGGGRRFTQVLADELKIEFAEAEQIKRNEAEITFDVSPSSTLGRTGRIPRIPGASSIGRAPGATRFINPAQAETSPPPAPSTTAAPAPSRPTVDTGSNIAASGAPASPPAEPRTLEQVSINLTAMPPMLEDLETMPSLSDFTPPVAPPPAGAVDELTLEPLDKPAPVPSVKPPAARSAPPPMTAPPPDVRASAPPQPQAETIKLEDPIESLPPSLEALDAELAPAASGEAAPKAGVVDEKRKKQLSAALVREAASLCAALENAVLSCRQQTKQAQLKVDRVYITGGSSRLKGLSEFMGRRLRMEVMPLEPFRQLSLTRLPPQKAEALRAEQCTMAVAVGLAVSELEKGAFSFLLWPLSLKQSKLFWSRGAYLYYAAGMVALTIGLGLYTPIRNKEALLANNDKADQAVGAARVQTDQLNKLVKDNDEKRQQRKQIVDNTQSGQYFLNLLAELKSTGRTSPDIYLTQISTAMPNVVKVANEELSGSKTPPPPDPRTSTDRNAGPETFQARRQVYLRGFVRSNHIAKMDDDAIVRKEQSLLIERFIAFYTRLVPHPLEPDHRDNLFKDIRPIWLSREYKERDKEIDKEKEKEKEKELESGYVIKEFVLEAYTEGTREVVKSKTAPVKGAKVKPGTGAAKPNAAPKAPAAPEPATPPVEAAPQPVPAPVQAQPQMAQPAPAAPVAPKKYVLPKAPVPAAPEKAQ